jgi:hypothetical protein
LPWESRREEMKDADHVGEFSEGEEKLEHHPELDDHTHFAEGQEAARDSKRKS